MKMLLFPNQTPRFGLSAIFFLLFVSAVSAQWTNVGVGIDYQYFRVGGTNDFFVTRMSRTNLAATIDTSWGQGKLSSLETIPNQAKRYDDAITWWGGEWGARNDVVVAINGGFYDLGTYEISGGQIQSGWYGHFFADSFSGFAWKTNRTPFIGECVNHQPAKVYVKFQANGNTMPIDGINRAPAASDLVIFTPQYNNQTPLGTRTEVLVEMTKPNLTTSGTGYTSGIIRSKAQNTGSTWIPFDHIVISADGSDGTTLNGNASVGAEVRIFQDLYEENEPDVQGNGACQTATGVNWANVFASINSNFHFLKNNVVRVPDAVAHPGYIGYVNLNPRTAICYNADYVFFLVVDGRSAQSAGIGCADMGYWAKNVLGATDGVNIDGGGSSIMVVNGSIKNVPSDGSPRPVCNGVQMINVQPKVQSSTFAAGMSVTTTGSASVRLGPGTNYYNFSSVSSGATGTIVSHTLNGVQAKGNYWWKCNFSGTVGWVAESLLSAPPTIAQQPSITVVATNGTANFTVVANGSSPLRYQWQKNSSNLSNGGHYSGCTTATLTISNADGSDAADYRCVVTNDYGNITSSNATLTVGGSCTPDSLVNGDFEGGNTGGVGTGWTGYQRSPNPTTGWSIETASPPQGTQYQQIANTSSTGGGGVRQDVTGCVVGATYQIAGWFRGNSDNAVCTVKVSPTASTDWSAAIHLDPVQSTSGSTWTAFSGTVVATGTSMTIWLDGQTTGSNLNKAECFDAVTITCVVPAQGPVITQQPLAQNPCAGDTVTFHVTATGSGTLSYHWQTNGVNIGDGTHYAGCTTATLWVTNVGSADAANYRCLVADANGSLPSSTVALTLHPLTTITSQPSAQNACSGADASFSVNASGDGTLTYQWQTNGVNINNNSHYGGCATATLWVTNVSSADSVNFRCVVTGGCGSVTSSAPALALRAVTTISQHPVATNLCAGVNTTFSVTATGDGALTYQWQTNGVNLSNGSHYGGATSATLWVTNVGSVDAVNYRCVVTGGCGSVNSGTAGLTVRAATAISNQPFAQNVTPGATVMFTVGAVGDGGLTYQWQTNGLNITNNSHYGGCTTGTLWVTNVGSADAVSYRCVVTGGCGSAASSSVLLSLPGSGFFSADYSVNRAIPDGGFIGISDTRTVSTMLHSITNLKVRLKVSGTYNGDLYCYLAHSSGYSVLLNRVGRSAGRSFGYGDPGLEVTFEDGATNDVHSYRLVVTGNENVGFGTNLMGNWVADGRTNRPTVVLDADTRPALLNAVNGLDPSGNWTIFLADLVGGDSHTLVSWGLEISGTEEPPAPPVATISGKVKLQAYLGSSRMVRFIASAVSGGMTNYLQTNEVNLSFTAGEASYSIEVPTNTTHLSAKTAWHLRKRLPVTLVGGAATVDFTGSDWLLGGDLVTVIGSTSIEDTDNLVNAVDLGLLLGYYLNAVGSDPMIGRADIDGDGVVDMVNAVDLSVLLGNYLVSGDGP